MTDPYTTPIKKSSLLPPMAPRKERDPIKTIINFTTLPDSHPTSPGQKIIISHAIKLNGETQETVFVCNNNYPEFLRYAQAKSPKLCQQLLECKTSYIDWNFHVDIPRNKLKEIAEMCTSLHYESIIPIKLQFD